MKTLSAIGAVIAVFLMVATKSYAADNLVIASSDVGSSDTPVIVAEQLGYFRAVGINITLFDAGGGNNAISSVLGGSAQIALASIFNASKPAAKGQPLKIIGVDTTGFGEYLFVRSASLRGTGITEASSLADKARFLQGKTIGVNDIGGTSGEFAGQILAAAGLTNRAARIINLNSPEARLAALKLGRIDAIIGSPPEPETSIVDGYGTMLVDPAKDLPNTGPIAASVEVVRADFLDHNRALLLRYETAVQRGRQLIQTDPAAARDAYYAYIASYARAALLTPSVEDMAWNDIAPSFSRTPVLDQAEYANAQKFFQLPEGLAFTTFVDNSIAQQAAH